LLSFFKKDRYIKRGINDLKFFAFYNVFRNTILLQCPREAAFVSGKIYFELIYSNFAPLIFSQQQILIKNIL